MSKLLAITNAADALYRLKVGTPVYQRPDLPTIKRFDRDPYAAGAMAVDIKAPGKLLGLVSRAPQVGLNQQYVQLVQPNGQPYSVGVFFIAYSLAVDEAATAPPPASTPSDSELQTRLNELNQSEAQVYELLAENEALLKSLERLGNAPATQVAQLRNVVTAQRQAYDQRQAELRNTAWLRNAGTAASEYAQQVWSWVQNLFGISGPRIGAAPVAIPAVFLYVGGAALVATAIAIIVGLLSRSRGSVQELTKNRDIVRDAIVKHVPPAEKAEVLDALDKLGENYEKALKPGFFDSLQDLLPWVLIGAGVYFLGPKLMKGGARG